MPARNDNFPWMSHYGHYKFFEDAIRAHSKVSLLTQVGSGIYELKRSRGDLIRVFICECYAFSVSEYTETVGKIGDVNAVVINSAWCGYSPSAKKHCRGLRVGLFRIGEFMSALNLEKYWLYLTEGEKKFFRDHGWL